MSSVDGIHDMGGMQGFGRVVVEAEEPTFHAPWEGRVHAMVYLLIGGGVGSIDAFRHAIERITPVEYLSAGYYGRWVRAAETLLVERGLLREGELTRYIAGDRMPPSAGSTVPGERLKGFVREVATEPRFAVGAEVRARNLHPVGHTRLPGYVRGKRGVVRRVHGAYVLPDTNAHGRGECPEYLFSVRFDGAELWGEGAESAAPVSVDLFDRYLDPIGA